MDVKFGGSPFDDISSKYMPQGNVLNNYVNVPKPNSDTGLSSNTNTNNSDTCVFKKTKNGKEKVNVFRIWFCRLKPEQIEQINKTGKLPDNMKIRPNSAGTGYHIAHNIFGLTNGTRTVPEGYEFRRNILGFTRLIPKDTEGFWLKKKSVNWL